MNWKGTALCGPFGRVPGMAHISEVEAYLQPRAVTPKA